MRAATSGGDTSPPEALAPLLKRCGLGDEYAFADLYDQVSPRIFGLVKRIIRDPAQSEEVTQEAFLEIWRQAARFDLARGSALAWMMTIAHRRAVDRVRSVEATSTRDVEYGHRHQAVEYDSTSEVVQSRMDAQRVRKAMGSLTDTQRQAIELAYFRGCTHTEVATMLGVPLGTAKSRVRDGLIRLRDTIGGER
ncbi:sigma-70 family RNA polymerase sigma factor [Aeromicrobium sp. 636]|uniref:ECF RNA polymerase sigma factor SigK n=1 Tax=Aeromicrobium senzhongii TaxID=2663859 RepID=A0A8I0ESZ6_9ACTN|nr:ECF RNA polymerase sigma factor SigK [Aeromicrobium senzhongii]MBC9225063.1 ECF RNA polymerase sigma factor SigK [Aeromicrobium senzhongii]MCQ3997174.1 sigma-70 family RNA polymerase sigma factor [Aeromicrobium sp. 636]MTB87113.1 sigma-70 family RNA polymerase sigma factor [Aeromicrobium senzhongii]QNL95931.1 ECF RNA polymerase sigma factor SigK [Aeromicrobium senzhongii]